MRLTTAVAAGVLALSACGGGTSTTTATTTTSTRPAITTTTSTTIGTAGVPDVGGKNLVTARATLAAAGFKRITANDGTQKRRVPADDWVVYRQLPPAGARMMTTEYVYLELLGKGDRYRSPGTTPCPRFVQC